MPRSCAQPRRCLLSHNRRSYCMHVCCESAVGDASKYCDGQYPRTLSVHMSTSSMPTAQAVCVRARAWVRSTLSASGPPTVQAVHVSRALIGMPRPPAVRTPHRANWSRTLNTLCGRVRRTNCPAQVMRTCGSHVRRSSSQHAGPVSVQVGRRRRRRSPCSCSPSPTARSISMWYGHTAHAADALSASGIPAVSR